ncbi:2-amino-4-hydroxy-6-hydroxymethyldihydropteridine diphosphokinase [Aneurinibacillus sp. Ricciae_BoGa-3]|uniref:2-amino-4-hydroxy-6- hydroxymethyldihydropteridine diphosphokinase n=1 Tax=Aneurinibacillus sp. Ricciae_BoGa-3 TaxID=3022697 RepID=UPI002342077E|nr:2-amino-4-hydroxy-6-hydroxymethyldihydropteridine diphosphokinase [Aneurinibacillus sp. Ricciae_BoGa-3]WCK54652.1 2-amino-4-hydroxy-6-hydroxymethyldihydropteridine diphosphokinase [Aneurinibacillus sp. Ricciae_BoGa-3]
MHTVYLGLGSNIGDREYYLAEAVRRLEDSGVSIKVCSSIYETAPVGYVEQAAFLNIVVLGKTDLSAKDLLGKTQDIERSLGRTRDIHWGPRTLDIDILLYDSEQLKWEELQIPHPRMVERAFVIVPLAEIAPDICIPLNGGITPASLLPFMEGNEGVKQWKHLVWAK